MKLFLVISDTHGDIFTAIEIIKKYPQINGIIHLGDYYKDANRLKAQFPGLEFFIVPGNCDFVFDMPSDILLDIEGKRLLLTHGHRYDVKNGLERLEIKAKKRKCRCRSFWSYSYSVYKIQNKDPVCKSGQSILFTQHRCKNLCSSGGFVKRN